MAYSFENRLHNKISLIALSTIMFVGINNAKADEGLWKYGQIPKDTIAKKLNVRFSDEKLDSIQKASVKVDNMCSGAVVSPDGLVQTNSHCLVNLYKKSNVLIENGFVATSRATEQKLIGFSIEMPINPSPKSTSPTNITSENISSENITEEGTVYSKTYNDIRLVFAPEFSVGLFGFMTNNFTYPNASFDVAYLRIYDENGKPLNTPNYFKWLYETPKISDPVFVSGYPGYTNRNLGYNNLYFEFNSMYKGVSALGDVAIANMLKQKNINYAEVFDLKNSVDFIDITDKYISDGTVKKYKDIELKHIDEAFNKNTWQLQISPNKDSNQSNAGTSFLNKLLSIRDKISEKEYVEAAYYVTLPSNILEISDLISFIGDGLDSDKEITFSDGGETYPKVLNRDVEFIKIKSWAELMKANQGKIHTKFPSFLDKNTPDEIANQIITACDEYFQKPIERGYVSEKCIKTPVVRQTYNLFIKKSVMAYGILYGDILNEQEITKEFVKTYKNLYNSNVYRYDDADFSLRFTYGTIKPENGKDYYSVNLGNMFQRASNDFDKKLPKRWIDAKNNLNLNTMATFISDTDIIGGNSGSPIFNAKYEMIGSIYDGNEISVVNNYIFTDEMRAAAVSNSAIAEVLSKIYKMDWLLTELGVTQK